MPKLNVIQIFSGPAVYNGVNKTSNKPYSIYSWGVLANIDGGQQVIVTIKSMKQITLEVKEYDVKKSNYNGQVSYMIQSENKPFQKSGYSRPTYSVQEIDALWGHGLGKLPTFRSHIKNMTAEDETYLLVSYMMTLTSGGAKIENKPVSATQTVQSGKLPEATQQKTAQPAQTTSKLPQQEQKNDVSKDFYSNDSFTTEPADLYGPDGPEF